MTCLGERSLARGPALTRPAPSGGGFLRWRRLPDRAGLSLHSPSLGEWRRETGRNTGFLAASFRIAKPFRSPEPMRPDWMNRSSCRRDLATALPSKNRSPSISVTAAVAVATRSASCFWTRCGLSRKKEWIATSQYQKVSAESRDQSARPPWCPSRSRRNLCEPLHMPKQV
jgi:hypothetical protein